MRHGFRLGSSCEQPERSSDHSEPTPSRTNRGGARRSSPGFERLGLVVTRQKTVVSDWRRRMRGSDFEVQNRAYIGSMRSASNRSLPGHTLRAWAGLIRHPDGRVEREPHPWLCARVFPD